MTDNERTLHTIYSTCIKPYHPVGETDTPKDEQMQNRLDEIERMAGKQVIENALENVGT